MNAPQRLLLLLLVSAWLAATAPASARAEEFGAPEVALKASQELLDLGRGGLPVQLLVQPPGRVNQPAERGKIFPRHGVGHLIRQGVDLPQRREGVSVAVEVAADHLLEDVAG